MQDHIRDLLHRFQYSEQLKETAAFRILLGGEDPSHVMADLDIHNSYTLRWLGESISTQDPDGKRKKGGGKPTRKGKAIPKAKLMPRFLSLPPPTSGRVMNDYVLSLLLADTYSARFVHGTCPAWA